MKTISKKFMSTIRVVFISFLSILSAGYASAQTMTGTGAISSFTYSGNRSRQYKVYVPQSYDGSSAVPMIFALHGCQMDHDDAIRLWNLDLIADQHNVIVVFPFVTGFSELRNTNCWGYWFSQHVSEGGGGEVDDLYGMAQEVEGRYSIDPGKRFITGLSSGGGMVVAEAIAHNEYWTAAAPVAGLAYGDWASSVTSNPEQFKSLSQHVSAINAELNFNRAVPMMVIQSSEDTTVQPRAMELIRDSQLTVWGADLNADGTESCNAGSVSCTLTTYNDAQGSPLVKTLYYSGVFNKQAQYGKGHYWPGTDVEVDTWTNVGPVAAEYMWAFFDEMSGGTGGGAVCTNAGDTTPPAVPTGFAVSSVGSSSVQLVLNANGESDLHGYKIYNSNGSALTSSPVASTSITVSGLASSTQYTVTAVAVDNCGNESGVSSSVTFTTDTCTTTTPSTGVTDTVVNHYVANRIDLNTYLSMGGSIGYNTSVTLYQSGGSWSTTDPGGSTGSCGGGNTGGGNNGGNNNGSNGGNTGTGSWSTSSSLAGMEVHTYLPSTVTSNGKRALMITLHGCSQSNEDVRDGWEWEDPAIAYGMVVAAPMAPNGGVLIGCWDYYDSNHSGSSPGRHDDNLVSLANGLVANTSLNLDPDQVYVSGLSSGGGETMVMGCVAPQIFAGIGINAGPAVGTSSGQIGSVPFSVSASSVANTCRNFSVNDSEFNTQVTSVVHGNSDSTVSAGYAEVDAAAMANVYGASKDSGTNSISGGGTETTWSDGSGVRVSKIMVSGLSHAWPAGSGSGGGTYTNHSTVDYPEFLTEFLFDNNRRADFGGGVTPTSTPVPTATPVPGGSTPTPTPTASPGCDDVTAYNYYHKTGGRATSSGSAMSPNYVANGSGDAMAGSTWGNTTLYSYNGSYWSVGSCP